MERSTILWNFYYTPRESSMIHSLFPGENLKLASKRISLLRTNKFIRAVLSFFFFFKRSRRLNRITG